MNETALLARIAPSVGSIEASEWNALAGSDNPFIRHEFLAALEISGSVGEGTGWQPAPLRLETESGTLLGAMPSYVKMHSQGEFVFDHGWADAYERAGGRYYPKLQVAVPFTPATGPRLLLAEPRRAPLLIRAAEQVAAESGLSSIHATFLQPAEREAFEAAGWLLRSDIQFHWFNRGFSSFEDFLATLSSRKRKAIRRERAEACEGLEIRWLTGSEIEERHWDAFWLFYQNTGARKWGHPYLTREAFSLFGNTLGDSVMLALAYEEGEPIAGALNFAGADALYGRYWGCSRERRFLHFELCYYQAIERAIAMGLERVEAGAQGGHKLARGYEPVETWSAHWIADPAFREAIEDFLERERRGVRIDRDFLARRMPFRNEKGSN